MKKSIILISFFLTTCLGYSNAISELLQKAEKVYNSQPDSSFEICLEAENRAENKNDEVNYGLAKLCKVRFYLLKNRLEIASEELAEAIALFQKNNYQQGLASAYIAMANIDGRIKKDEEEIEYLEKANEIFLSLNDTIGALKTLSNLSLNYIGIGNLEKGKQKLIQIEELSHGMPEKEFYYLNQNWGIYYQEIGNYETALRRFESAKNIASKLKMIDSEATVLYLISNVYIETNNIDKAIQTIQKSYEIAVENNLITEQLDALKTMHKIYELQGNVTKAYNTFKQMTAIKDTIYNIEKINKLNDYEKKIELTEKENVIAAKNLELERNKNQLLKDKYGIYTLIGIVIIISVSVIFLLINLKNRKKAHQIISQQKTEVEHQKRLVEDKNHEITSSITYAKRIQEAVLPSNNKLKEHLTDSFVFYKAKDIVSGDFYWLTPLPRLVGASPTSSSVSSKGGEMLRQAQHDNIVLFAVVDCTGHGVPGAFMSIVGNNGLNKAVRELKLTKPSHILDALNLYVTNSLDQKNNEVKDGMDIALCALHLDTLKLEYAGAFNPLYLLRKDKHEIEIVKADKQAMGQSADLFTNHEIQLQKGDTIYIFTDGLPDQFGGKKGKKFSYKRFRELLQNNRELTMQQQREALDRAFHDWNKNEEQVDDVCVLGVRI